MSTKYNVSIVLDVVNKAKGQLATATKQVNSFVEANKEGLTSIRNAAGVAFGAISAGAGLAIKGYQKQALAESQVRQGIISTGEVAKRTFEELKQQASELQDVSLFGDEDILKGVTAQLLTFTNVTEEQFDRAQKAALDLATRLDGDLKGASIQLGKALNDPVANLSALSRSGIQFSEDQKTVIKSLAETGRIAEAQTVILDELEKQYGGSAQAALDAIGPSNLLKKEFGDMMEVLGGALIPAFNEMAQSLRPVIESISNRIKANPELVSTITKVALGVTGAVVAATSLAFILPTLTAGFVTLISAAGPITAVVAGLIAGKAAVDLLIGPQNQLALETAHLNDELRNNIIQLDELQAELDIINQKRLNGAKLTTDEAERLQELNGFMGQSLNVTRQLAQEISGSGSAYEELAKANSKLRGAQKLANDEIQRFGNVQDGTKEQIQNAKNEMKIARFELLKYEAGLEDVTNTQDLMKQGLAKVQGALGQLSTASTQDEFNALQEEAIQTLKALLAVQQGIIATSNEAGGSSFLSTKAIAAQHQIKELQGLYRGLQTQVFSTTKEIKSFGGSSSKAIKEVVDESAELEKKMKENMKEAFDTIKDSGQEAYDALNTAVADSAIKVNEYTKELDGVNDKFNDLAKQAGQDAFDIGLGISQTEQKTVEELGKRYASLADELDKLESKRDKEAFTTNYDPKTLENIKKVQEEIAFIESQGSIETIKQAKAFQEMSKAQQIVAKNEQDIAIAREKQGLLQSLQQSPQALDTIQTIQTDGGQVETYYKDVTGELIKIQDIQNQQFAINQLRKQEELAAELTLINTKKDAEIKALEDVFMKRKEFEEKFVSVLELSTDAKEAQLQRVADKQRDLFGLDSDRSSQFVPSATPATQQDAGKTIQVSLAGANFTVREEADIEKIAIQLARKIELGELNIL